MEGIIVDGKVDKAIGVHKGATINYCNFTITNAIVFGNIQNRATLLFHQLGLFSFVLINATCSTQCTFRRVVDNLRMGSLSAR